MHHHAIGHSRRSGVHKQLPKVFLKMLQISQGNNCVGVSYLQSSKPSGLQLYKKWPLRRSFPVKFEKFWRTPILETAERLLLCIDYFIIYWFLQSSTGHVLHFYKELLLYYAIKTIELMTREAVSFEEVFHWTKFLAFES